MNESITNGGPAFPIHHATWENGRQITSPHEGMSLRDWFAGQALAGLLAGQFSESGRWNLSDLPKESFKIADAMIMARNQHQ